MPSLDGYSLNKKMDELHESVRADIVQLQKDFHRLYQLMADMKENKGEKDEKASKVPSTKKAKKSTKVSKEVVASND